MLAYVPAKQQSKVKNDSNRHNKLEPKQDIKCQNIKKLVKNTEIFASEFNTNIICQRTTIKVLIKNTNYSE